MQQTQQEISYVYSPLVHIAKNKLHMADVRADGLTQYQVRDTSTGEDYYAAFIERAGVYFIQPLIWHYDIGEFEPDGQAVPVMQGVEIIGTVMDIYRFHRVPTAFEYENCIKKEGGCEHCQRKISSTGYTSQR